MESYIAVCPICGKKTCLRIQVGGYLNEYPIRINCINCRALLKGTFVMNGVKSHGLTMCNADVEDCDVVTSVKSGVLTSDDDFRIRNADYIAEISGELPCKHVVENKGGLPTPIFLNAIDNMDSFESVEERIARLTYFAKNMADWDRTKNTAFQLLNEGSIEYIAIALKNKIGDYTYECDHYLKSLHCLQEVVLEESKYLFVKPQQKDCIMHLIAELSKIDKEEIHNFCSLLGGSEGLIRCYRKVIDVFSSFMNIYPNVLPAETFMRFKDEAKGDQCISTCSFSDIKTFYQDGYESLLSLLYIPVCLDNLVLRGDFQTFDSSYDDVQRGRGVRNFNDYRKLDNGTRVNKMNVNETYQKMVDIPANRPLRNGIGHNNIKYDGVSQMVIAYDLKIPNKETARTTLMNMSVDCIGLARSSVIFAEIILFMMREEFRRENVTTIIHPSFYKGVEPNAKCPCGSNKKYKKCCRNLFEALHTN